VKLKFKSINTAILIMVLPAALIALILLTSISYYQSKSIINAEIKIKMDNQIAASMGGIQKSLLRHGEVAESLAKVAESLGSQTSKENYAKLLEGVLSTNEESFGAGIWFEPYKYKADMKYFGPYTYRDNGKIIYTDDYSKPEYDYPQYDWYKNGMNAKTPIIWASPYYDDVSGITMVTATAPFYDSSKKFMGVSTADIDLSSLQKMISEIKVGETGKAFLLASDGTYIADNDKEKVMKKKVQDESDKNLASLMEKVTQKARDSFTFKSGKESYILYYSDIPETKWVIGIYISQKELYAPVTA
jgi:methyl-accepting chemotaxis protein